MNKKRLITALLLVAPITTSAAVISVYSNDFDSGPVIAPGVTASWTTPGASLQSVQGYTAAGFSGNFLSSYNIGPTAGANLATLTLNNLPAHDSISIGGLLAIIDSWDSTNGSPAPDFLSIAVDGTSVFQDTYNNASGSNNNLLGLSDINGGKVARGFTGWLDQAFNLIDSPLTAIPHTASSIQIAIAGNGAGWQGGSDEAWGIENFSLSVNTTTVPEPESLALFSLGLLGLGFSYRKQKV